MRTADLLSMNADPRALARAPRAISAAYVRAGNRAVRETARWARTAGLRAISKADQIPIGRLRKAKRGALKVVRRGGADSATTWLGIAPVKAGYLGKARQTRGGVRVGKHHYPDAFVRTMPSGYVGVFERMGKSGGGAKRWTKGRPTTSSANLPLVDELYFLRNSETALRRLEPQVGGRVATVMQRLLNLELDRATR